MIAASPPTWTPGALDAVSFCLADFSLASLLDHSIDRQQEWPR
jgi:hypothetical protein